MESRTKKAIAAYQLFFTGPFFTRSFAAVVVSIFRGSRVRRGLSRKVGNDIKHIAAHKGLHMLSSSLDDAKKPSTIEFRRSLPGCKVCLESKGSFRKGLCSPAHHDNSPRGTMGYHQGQTILSLTSSLLFYFAPFDAI